MTDSLEALKEEARFLIKSVFLNVELKHKTKNKSNIGFIMEGFLEAKIADLKNSMDIYKDFDSEKFFVETIVETHKQYLKNSEVNDEQEQEQEWQ